MSAVPPVSERPRCGTRTRTARALEETVQKVHGQLLSEAGGPHVKAPATTLTLVLLVWPRAYLVHVGDSRAYVRRRGRVQALTRDQTFGEYMVSAGAWTEEQAAHSRTAETLASAVVEASWRRPLA